MGTARRRRGLSCRPPALPIAGEGARVLAESILPSRMSGEVGWIKKRLSDEVVEAAEGLKFEVLVSRIWEQMGDAAVDAVSVMCEAQLPGKEHKAIATLVETGMIRTVLTTNFDQGIELAMNETSLMPGFVAKTLPVPKHVAPVCIHLHGSVEDTASLVTTMERLGTEEQRDMVAEAIDRVLPTKLLVVGYSGTGDLDVFPAIRAAAESGTKLYWANPAHLPVPDVPGVMKIAHDLRSPHNSLLMRWAGHRGSETRWLASESVQARAAMRVRVAFEHADEVRATRAALAILLEARRDAVALAMLSWAAANVPGFDVDPHEAGVTYERLGAYRSAAAYLQRAAAAAKERGEWALEADHLGGAGFTLRRAGQAREAAICYDLAHSVLDAAIAAGASPSFAALDNVFRGRCSALLESRPTAAQMVALECDLQRLLSHPECDALRRALLALSFAELRLAQGRREEAIASALDGASQCEAILHLEGWAKAARVLASLNRRAGRAMLKTVNERIADSGQASRDREKNQLSAAVALLPLSPRMSQRLQRNSVLRRWRCRKLERLARSIERRFGWHGPAPADTQNWYKDRA